MTTLKSVIIFLTLFGFSALDLKAQGSSENKANKVLNQKERIEALQGFVRKYESQLNSNLNRKDIFFKQPTMSTPYLDEVFTFEDTLSFGSASYALLKAEQEQLMSDWGLDLNLGFLNNFEQTLLDSEGRFYRRRIQTGVNFELLSNGLFENRLKAKMKSYEMQLLTIDSNQEEKKIASRKVYFRLLNIFNRLRIKAIDAYLVDLRSEIQLLREVSAIGYDVRDVLRELVRLELDYRMELQDFQSMSIQIPDYPLEGVESDYMLPLLDVRIQKLFESSSEDTTWVQKEALISQMNDLRYKWWRNISLGFDSRYNYFDRLNERTNPFLLDREFFSVSATLRIPFETFKGGSKRMAHLATQAQLETLNQAKLTQGNSLIGNFEEYQNRKRRVQELISEMDITQQRIEDESRIGTINEANYNPARLLRLNNQQFMLQVEYIEALEYLYMTLFRIWLQRPELPISSFTSVPVIRPVAQTKLRATSIYMWSKSIITFSEDELLKSVIANGFNKVLMSAPQSEELDLRKVKRLGSELKKMMVGTAMIVSNNELLKKDSLAKEQIRMYVERAVALNLTEVHLDLEPHTFDTWDQNRDEFEQRYLDILSVFRKETAILGIKLSVAIPHFYDNLLTSISSSVDQIYVMCYGTTDMEIVQNRLKQERNDIHHDKLTIVLRADDFSNKQSIYGAMDALEQIGGRSKFAIHDYESFSTTTSVGGSE